MNTVSEKEIQQSKMMKNDTFESLVPVQKHDDKNKRFVNKEKLCKKIPFYATYVKQKLYKKMYNYVK